MSSTKECIYPSDVFILVYALFIYLSFFFIIVFCVPFFLGGGGGGMSVKKMGRGCIRPDPFL